ncbi:Nramp family divalent metal transporter [Thioalkalivibrio nitratireducens]|nr:Nramp family divalent metal transporter [Thioalkalivibrio nitratireducens]
MTRSAMSPLRAAIGPGLLMAGAAVGVSHLVQSTRAGAEFGLLLLPVVLLACLLKYPFLEFGPRYVAATGENLLVGYRRLGRWALALFALITIATMFIILAVVTVVTAGLAGFVLGIDASPATLSVGILLACVLLLAIGNYRGLDLAMKMIMAALTVSTVAAVVLAFGGLQDMTTISGLQLAPQLWTATGFAFLLALVGWMPIPLEVAVWHSLWTQERAQATGQTPTLRNALIDFRIGYIGATLLAAAFLLLGALLMYASGMTFADSAVGFSAQLVDLYAGTLGEWSRPLIAVAALSTMFSTTLAVTDAYPRVLAALLAVARFGPDDRRARDPHNRATYLLALALVIAGALLILYFAGAAFTQLIDFATTLSFLAAPVIAWLTLRVVTDAHMPAAARPGFWLRTLAWLGLAFGVGFALIWVGWRMLA